VQDEYKITHRRTTNELEHEDASDPLTKRVLLYGWDGSNKVRIAADNSGNVKIDPTNLDARFLKLDFSNIPTSPTYSGYAANGNTLELWWNGALVQSWTYTPIAPDLTGQPWGLLLAITHPS
jgi:hypothetical protein